VRYVRDYLNGSTSNTGDHWVEIEVYGSRTVAYIGNYYEWDASANTPTKYYYAGAERVAMRTGTGSGTTGLKWLLDNHASTALSTGLGSTAITADGATGSKLSELRYKPWGEIRYASQPTMTSLRYTGQRMEGIGLYDYGARWFDASIGRFVQADSIVPNLGDPQAWDRYAAMNNNPVVFVDPSGHMADQGGGASSMGEDWWKNRQEKHEKKESSHPFDSSLGENNKNELTNGQKIGKALTTAFVETIIVLPTEAGFFITSLVLLNSGPAGVLVDLAVIPVEIGVADFGVSLALSTYKSIESDHDEDFRWTIIPALVSNLPQSTQDSIHGLIPGLFRK
jgi:RHS repeat-associated protein